jgi:tetratricopeptide (TPR) repeat protein
MSAPSSPIYASIRSNIRRFSVFAALSLVCALGPTLTRAQSGQREFQLTERTGEQLGKLQPFIDAKNWDGAAKFVTGIIATTEPNSYDQAYLNDVLANLYLQIGDYNRAIPPMETALRLTDTYGYLDTKAAERILDYLAKLYYQEGTSTKSPALQQQYLTKATVYLKRMLDNTAKPTADNILFYTSLLYNRAVLNPEKIDQELLNQAKLEAEKALLLSPRPKENFYLILLSTLQQQGNYKRAAEYYELLVKQYPSNKNYWQQLMAIYVTLAQEGDEKQVRENNLRAIVTIERAQALGFQNTPKDNYNLVGIYFNLGQFGKATELLSTGLKKGTIESTITNWGLLSSSYLQVNRENQAIDALTEAAKRFPKIGQLDFQIGQIYYSLEKAGESYRYLKQAITKGNLDKPASVYAFLAYICYELGKYEEGLEVITSALELSDADQSSQLTRLQQAMEDALNDQKAKAAQKSL